MTWPNTAKSWKMSTTTSRNWALRDSIRVCAQDPRRHDLFLPWWSAPTIVTQKKPNLFIIISSEFFSADETPPFRHKRLVVCSKLINKKVEERSFEPLLEIYEIFLIYSISSCAKLERKSRLKVRQKVTSLLVEETQEWPRTLQPKCENWISKKMYNVMNNRK